MFKKALTLQITLMMLIELLAGCGGASEPTQNSEPAATAVETPTLILATTTSTENSGLLGFILPDFETEYNAHVDVIAVGTGQALKLGEDGNADVLMVHARAKEDAFMDAGHGVRREDAAAGVEPVGDWYVSAGQGMGAVLTMADEQQAYTLSDRATYLARTLEGIDLEILVEGDPILFNPYGVIAVNPDKGEHIKADLANAFIDWLISVPTQEKIGQFGVAEFGSPLFTPDSAPWRAEHPAP
jgi:tungstate transport system substrate-binding protein